MCQVSNRIKYKSESACGADPECNEKFPDDMYDTDGDGYSDLYCDSNCYAYKCDASTECSSVVWYGSTYICSYNYRYSTSSPRYDWLTSPYEGYPWQSCFDNHDNDCDGLVDCADPDCAKVQNPNTGVICCQSDSDCSGYDPTTHTKYVCECLDSTKCNITGSSYTCKSLQHCYTNIDCEGGWCCDRDPSLPDECKGEGSCVKKGSTTTKCNNRYLCDPPNELVSFSNKKVSLLDLLINPFFRGFS